MSSGLIRDVGMRGQFKLSLVLLIAMLLGGCQQEKEDLNAYVARVKAQQKSDIPPIPVMKPYEKFEYAASEYKDPFLPTVVEVPEAEEEPLLENGISPDKNRRKEALEAFELAEVQFVGTLEQEKVWALVRAPDDVIHRVQVGNYMGRNHGRILAINESEIQLKEIVPKGRSGFIERETSVSVVEVN
jgi:type IV pilus assembly protein PilP